jgi:phytoene dehydrogenase-like protein
MVDDGIAVGVRLEDGTEHRAGAVIGSCDSHLLVHRLLGGRYIEPKLDAWHRERALMRPLTMVSFGVAMDFPDEPWLTTYRLVEPMSVAGEPIGHLLVRFFNHSDSFSPAGKTVVQVMLETPWAFWNDLYTTDREAYRAEKRAVAERVLSRLERFYPDLPGKVEVTDVATPVTYWRYTGSREGSYMGWDFDPSSIRVWFPRKLPGLERFYMAGMWSMSMGGFMPAIFSGMHAVQVMCREDGKVFGIPD